jgi:hypothetical protein
LPTAVGGARCGVRENARQSRCGPGSSVEFVDTDLTDEQIRRLCLLWQRSALETDDQNRFGGLVETDYDDLRDHLSDVELALRQALARSSTWNTPLAKPGSAAKPGNWVWWTNSRPATRSLAVPASAEGPARPFSTQALHTRAPARLGTVRLGWHLAITDPLG